jgi:hypothetical protein
VCLGSFLNCIYIWAHTPLDEDVRAGDRKFPHAPRLRRVRSTLALSLAVALAVCTAALGRRRDLHVGACQLSFEFGNFSRRRVTAWVWVYALYCLKI